MQTYMLYKLVSVLIYDSRGKPESNPGVPEQQMINPSLGYPIEEVTFLSLLKQRTIVPCNSFFLRDCVVDTQISSTNRDFLLLGFQRIASRERFL